MSKRVLIIYAHPEPSSLTRQLVDVSVECLTAQGHEVLQSDLYAMGWKAAFDEHDFPERANLQRLSFGAESAHAYRHGCQTADVALEQDKVLAADAVIFQFPLWWYGMPAIMKGWIDRVWAAGLAHNFKDAGNTYRYGDGAFKGKRAILSVAVGGPAVDYSPRGINGPLEQLLFPITHGSLYFPGFDVLPTFAVHGTGGLNAAGAAAAKEAWRGRLKRLFEEEPIPFRPQDGGDYSHAHELKPSVAAGQTGIMAHIAYDEKSRRQSPETEVLP
ncbi:NAD(P)H-dependent oxidoreductase [Pseudomonas fluorescens]|uniref:Glutathione-regulated potassium-efflux system ancillary protein KefF n=1 Tax=Pseudomonas fluorescens TaxID=294 RepID=A0A5E7PXG6_PSEFL|nr:NAD(P)H-dependent oxidoreductase [Pseudomonas fluorescens]VVP53938.1 Glutathione-regulated potassium-efflux system ancillary protein KefF [Pseudomonas fluorescens]